MIKLETRYTYKEIVNMGKSVSPSKGKVILNIDNKPVLFKFPYQEESFLIFGYNSETKELALAETHYTTTNVVTHWDVEEVKFRLNHLKENYIEIVFTADNGKNNFMQEFLFTQGYRWTNSGQKVITDIPKGGRILANPIDKLLTYSQPDSESRCPSQTIRCSYSAFFQSYLTYEPVFINKQL